VKVERPTEVPRPCSARAGVYAAVHHSLHIHARRPGVSRSYREAPCRNRVGLMPTCISASRVRQQAADGGPSRHRARDASAGVSSRCPAADVRTRPVVRRFVRKDGVLQIPIGALRA
jgi:hypothetical protein